MASQPLKVTDRVILVFEDRFLLLDDIHGEYTLSIEAEARKPSFKQGALKAVFHQPTQEATILYTLLAVFGTAAKPSNKHESKEVCSGSWTMKESQKMRKSEAT